MQNISKTIAVIGLGRIGFPSALLAAEKYDRVLGIDHNSVYIKSLKNGILPFLEEGLAPRFAESKLEYETDLIEADIYILAIPTLDKTNVFSTTPIEPTLQKISQNWPRALVIVESTLPLGAIKKLGAEVENALVYCPERVAPGSVFHELSTVPRCIASNDPLALKKAQAFYNVLNIKTLETSPQVAETVKLSENAFRDANIAFANRLSEICALSGTNVEEVINIANTHPRVNILKPGLGAGGACLAPSTRTLDSGRLFGAIREVNERQITRILNVLQQNNITTVALWGLSYKPNCDDLRFSKSMDLKALLESNEMTVLTWDPVAKTGDFSASLNAQAIVFGVSHADFRNADLCLTVRNESGIKQIIDFVNAIDIVEWNKEGFSCICA